MHGCLLLCLLSGAVFSLPYRFEIAFPLTYVALGIFLLLLRTDVLKTRYFRAFYCFSLGYLLPLYSWFSALYPFSALGFSKTVSVVLVLLGCLAVPAIQGATQSGIMTFSRVFGKIGGVLHALCMASLWVLAEEIHTFGALALPWGTIALSQTGCTQLLGTVSLFGTRFLSFLAVFVCDLAADAVHRKKFLSLLTPSVVLACACVLGILAPILPFAPQKTGQTVRVAALQGNISTDERWAGKALGNIYLKYRALTVEAAENGAELILLPECAIPFYFSEGSPLQEMYSELAQKYDCTVLTGILRREADGDHNSMVMISPDGSYGAYYDKQRLVPFGEYIPFSKDLKDQEMATSVTNPTLESETYRVGCFICFDSVFDGSERAAEESDFLAVSTNDAWFKDSSAIYQHLRFSKLRAAESGRMLLRSGNTGISALINSDGRILQQTEVLTEDILYGEIVLTNGKTLYGRTGDLIRPMAVLILVVASAFCIFKKRKAKT